MGINITLDFCGLSACLFDLGKKLKLSNNV